MNERENFRAASFCWIAGFTLLAASSVATAQVSLRTVVEMAQHNSGTVRLAQADVQKAAATLAETRDVFIPALNFGSGLPVFPEVGFTGNLPTIYDANVQSLAFSMSQFRYIQAAKAGLKASQLSLKDAQEQVALDASTAYIELDTVDQELSAARQQQDDAARLVSIEQQRAEAGVDPLSQLLQAQLTAAEIKLNALHLETRAATLAKQISVLTGLPPASIVPDHSSIPEIPAVSGDDPQRESFAMTAAQLQAKARFLVAKGDHEASWTPRMAFGMLYNRNTTLLNDVASYFNPNKAFPANNFSSGISIQLPLFDATTRAHARESAAEALRARVEAEQAQRQNEIQIVQLDSSLRELGTQAQIASLKQQIADEQLKAVTTQLEVGNGAVNAPGAPAQLTPQAEQQAEIDERQKYQDALETGLELSRARLTLLRALGHMQDWLNELQSK